MADTGQVAHFGEWRLLFLNATLVTHIVGFGAVCFFIRHIAEKAINRYHQAESQPNLESLQLMIEAGTHSPRELGKCKADG